MSETVGRRGRLFVIAAPSGAGKTSLVRALMEREPGLRFSISYTTRPQRPTEQHGRDYFFVGRDEFERMVAAGEFLEHARVFDNYYGTARRQVEQALAAGQDLILEIDWQGAAQVRAALPECISVFILPPVAAGARAPPARPRHRRRGGHPAPPARRRLRHGSLARVRPRGGQRRVRPGAGELQDVVAGRGQATRKDRPGLAELAAELTADERGQGTGDRGQ